MKNQKTTAVLSAQNFVQSLINEGVSMDIIQRAVENAYGYITVEKLMTALTEKDCIALYDEMLGEV